MELGKYLASKRHLPHEWGVNDCNTFIVEWIDKHYGTDWEGMLQFDYDSAIGAARFYRDLPFTAEEFMHMAGYDQVTTKPKTGDVLIQNFENFSAAWLVCLGYAFTIEHTHGFIDVDVNTLENYSTWRKA